MGVDQAVEKVLRTHCGVGSVKGARSVPGGDINEAYRYDTDNGNLFVKVNHLEYSEAMFRAEAMGLEAIRATNTVRVPAVHHVAPHPHGGGILVMEHLALGYTNEATEKELGQALARLHTAGGETRFGFGVDNTIGSTPQINTWTSNWVEFFRDHRLRYQFDAIKKNRNDPGLYDIGQSLLGVLPRFFKGVSAASLRQPALLHGDLWSGNWSSLEGSPSTPVLYDPACYYGHWEAELGIMMMFGGFGKAFFKTYHDALPKEEGFEERMELYKLYHYLNHYLMFGGGYRSSCTSIIEALLKG